MTMPGLLNAILPFVALVTSENAGRLVEPFGSSALAGPTGELSHPAVMSAAAATRNERREEFMGGRGEGLGGIRAVTRCLFCSGPRIPGVARLLLECCLGGF